MDFIKKKTVNFFYFLLFLSGMVFYSSCENDIEVVKSITATHEMPAHYAENIEIEFTDSGLLQIKIIAANLELYRKDDNHQVYEFKKGITVFFYDRNREINSRFKADYAIYQSQSEIWEARGNVVAVNTKGEILQTEQLFWDTRQKKIYTDQFAKVTDETSEILGNGFISDEDFNNWEFKKVTGIINIENAE